MGTQLPSKRGTAASPRFSVHVYCGQTAGWSKMPLGMEVGLAPAHIALDGDRDLPLQKGAQPQFLARVCCDETAGWIKMPLGREIGLGAGGIVLDWDPAPTPPRKAGGGSSPHFSVRIYCGQTVAHLRNC